MGQKHSRKQRIGSDAEVESLASDTHFTTQEIQNLKDTFRQTAGRSTESLNEELFKKTLHRVIRPNSPKDDVFLERLFKAFDVDNNKEIDFREFVDGLSAFMKGTSEEKLELSFKLYDMNQDGLVTQEEMIDVMKKLASVLSTEDQSMNITQAVARLFEDVDLNGDGRLTLEEFKLSAMKEPLVIDYLTGRIITYNLLHL
ncbi:uncharacterized protein VTP21DRAFT_6306 [Calcarisporiella thermophila]|uniref:uncharacterized protein n=1 Tax=Calcarisporiella thermophila TaxID=911321 RepID=UPI003742D2DF